MLTKAPSKMAVQTRRNRIKSLALKGRTTPEITKELGLAYQTVYLDLKTMGIIPAKSYKKENA